MTPFFHPFHGKKLPNPLKNFSETVLASLFILLIGCQAGEQSSKGGNTEKKALKKEKSSLELKSDTLTDKELNKFFPQEVKERWGIHYPIYRTYRYLDEAGEHFFVMTESSYEPKDKPAGDHPSPFNDSIKGHKFRMEGDELKKEWDLRDFILEENTASKEYSIWFWTNYCSFKDADEDGRIEPIIVYGTSGRNYTSDGRIKILVYDEGEKYAIRHQNGTLDQQRHTRIEAKFSDLSEGIRTQVNKLMERMEADDNAIFTERPIE